MEYLCRINNRNIFYASVNSPNWLQELPGWKWILLPFGNEPNVPQIIELVDKCLAYNPSYICALGKSCELIHDICDESLVENNIKTGIDYFPITTWDNELNEGFWFALFCACNDDPEVDKLILVDFTEEGVKQIIVKALLEVNASN